MQSINHITVKKLYFTRSYSNTRIKVRKQTARFNLDAIVH